MTQNFMGVSEPERIVIHIEGEVLAMANIPQGVEVVVRQYLVPEHLEQLESEGCLDELERDEDGAYYTTWVGRGV